MALTITELAAAIRLGDGETEPTEPIAGILTRLLEVARATVTKHAASAPEAVRDEAAVRMAGYLYDAPEAARGSGYAAAWLNSGAAALCGPWITRRAGSDG